MKIIKLLAILIGISFIHSVYANKDAVTTGVVENNYFWIDIWQHTEPLGGSYSTHLSAYRGRTKLIDDKDGRIHWARGFKSEFKTFGHSPDEINIYLKVGGRFGSNLCTFKLKEIKVPENYNLKGLSISLSDEVIGEQRTICRREEGRGAVWYTYKNRIFTCGDVRILVAKPNGPDLWLRSSAVRRSEQIETVSSIRGLHCPD